MRRREFIAGLGSAAAWPVVARGQKQGQTARVGILNYFDDRYPLVTEFAESLRGLGYIQGQNLTIIHRWASGQLGAWRPLRSSLGQHRVRKGEPDHSPKIGQRAIGPPLILL